MCIANRNEVEEEALVELLSSSIFSVFIKIEFNILIIIITYKNVERDIFYERRQIYMYVYAHAIFKYRRSFCI